MREFMRMGVAISGEFTKPKQVNSSGARFSINRSRSPSETGGYCLVLGKRRMP